jgi:hypothetical protein
MPEVTGRTWGGEPLGRGDCEREVLLVLWVTGQRPTVGRTACAWLIGRFIDPLAQFAFAPPSVAPIADSDVGVPPANPDGGDQVDLAEVMDLRGPQIAHHRIYGAGSARRSSSPEPVTDEGRTRSPSTMRAAGQPQLQPRERRTYQSRCRTVLLGSCRALPDYLPCRGDRPGRRRPGRASQPEIDRSTRGRPTTGRASTTAAVMVRRRGRRSGIDGRGLGDVVSRATSRAPQWGWRGGSRSACSGAGGPRGR